MRVRGEAGIANCSFKHRTQRISFRRLFRCRYIQACAHVCALPRRKSVCGGNADFHIVWTYLHVSLQTMSRAGTCPSPAGTERCSRVVIIQDILPMSPGPPSLLKVLKPEFHLNRPRRQQSLTRRHVNSAGSWKMDGDLTGHLPPFAKQQTLQER